MAFSTSLRAAGRISEVVGLPATLMLCAWFQNRRVYVPTSAADPEHILLKIAGKESFTALVEAFPGEYLEIPEIDMQPLKQAGIVCRLTAKGVSAEDIASIASICPRTVRLIRKQLRLEGFPEIADLLPADDSEANHV